MVSSRGLISEDIVQPIRASRKSVYLKESERLGFYFVEREKGVEISYCPAPGEIPGQGTEYSADL
jgi:hypothetical protein